MSLSFNDEVSLTDILARRVAKQRDSFLLLSCSGTLPWYPTGDEKAMSSNPGTLR